MLIASFNLLSSSWSNITFLHPPPSLWHNSYTETAFKFPHGNSLFVSQLSDQLFLQSSVFWFLGLTSLLWWSFCSGSSLSSLGKGKKQIWELADVKIVFTLILENLFAYRMTEIIFPQMVEEIAHVTSKFPVLLLNVVVFQTCVWHYSQAHQRLLRLLFILGSLKAHEYRQLGHCRGPVNPLCYDWVTSCAPDISVPQFWKILMNATLIPSFCFWFYFAFPGNGFMWMLPLLYSSDDALMTSLCSQYSDSDTPTALLTLPFLWASLTFSRLLPFISLSVILWFSISLFSLKTLITKIFSVFFIPFPFIYPYCLLVCFKFCLACQVFLKCLVADK